MLPGVADGQAVDVGRVAEASTISNAAVFWPSMRHGVDRVDERDRVVLGELAGEVEAVVEVALDLEQPRAVHERLRHLAERDLALPARARRRPSRPGRRRRRPTRWCCRSTRR